MMKKLLTIAIIIAACAALCAAVLPQNDAGGKVPANAENGDLGTYKEELPHPTQREICAFSDNTPVMLAAEYHTPETVGKTAEKEEIMAAPVTVDEPGTAMQETLTALPAVKPAPQNSAPASADPYHTDIYPNNVYSEELIYDANGNLIGKIYIIPSEFGPDTIWIDGHAFYDVPGFGLVEWSGPSRRTEYYTMYESGVKSASWAVWMKYHHAVRHRRNCPNSLARLSTRPSTRGWRKAVRHQLQATNYTINEIAEHTHGVCERCGCVCLVTILLLHHRPQYGEVVPRR